MGTIFPGLISILDRYTVTYKGNISLARLFVMIIVVLLLRNGDIKLSLPVHQLKLLWRDGFVMFKLLYKITRGCKTHHQGYFGNVQFRGS